MGTIIDTRSDGCYTWSGHYVNCTQAVNCAYACCRQQGIWLSMSCQSVTDHAKFDLLIISTIGCIATQEPVVKETDLQPPKPLWHEDTRGRPNGGRGGGRGGPAGPLSSAAHRMLNHTMQVLLPPSNASLRPCLPGKRVCMHVSVPGMSGCIAWGW